MEDAEAEWQAAVKSGTLVSWTALSNLPPSSHGVNPAQHQPTERVTDMVDSARVSGTIFVVAESCLIRMFGELNRKRERNGGLTFSTFQPWSRDWLSMMSRSLWWRAFCGLGPSYRLTIFCGMVD